MLNNKKICFITVDNGAFINQRLLFGIKLLSLGSKVTILSSGSDHLKEILGYGFDFYDTKVLKSDFSFLSIFKSIFQYKLILEKIIPDYVQTTSMKPNIFGTIAARLAGVKKIVCIVNGLGYVFTSRYNNIFIKKFVLLLYRIVFNFNGVRVIVQNIDDYNFLLSKRIIQQERLFLIDGSGVDTSHFDMQPFVADCYTLLFVGRLIYSKGIMELLSICESISEKKKIKLIVAGDRDMLSPDKLSDIDYKKLISSEVVDFRGHVDNLNELFSETNICVLLSIYREGIPLSLIQAASCGKAIITLDSPGCREVVKNNNGFCLKRIKDVEEKIEFLLEDNAQCEIMGKKSRELVKAKFEKDKINSQMLSVYKSFHTN